jgi:hypothetical protein
MKIFIYGLVFWIVSILLILPSFGMTGLSRINEHKIFFVLGVVFQLVSYVLIIMSIIKFILVLIK